MRHSRSLVVAAAVLAGVLLSAAGLLSGCAPREGTGGGGGGQQSKESSPSAPATGSIEVTAPPEFPGASAFNSPKANPYFPLQPGRSWTYEGTSDDGEPSRDVVTVSSETTTILGVKCTVAEDKVYVNGVLEETTKDWYAATNEGDVWYFGEDTKTLDESGKVTSTEGSWTSGVNGAKPGIIMLAQPRVGDAYMQEFYKGQAEDRARVAETAVRVSVPYRDFDAALRIEEWTPLEPDIVSEKLYVAGVGQVSERDVKGGEEKFVLVSFR